MPDVVGYRAKIGVIVPSTNTVVEHDCSAVGAPGVTFHSSRFLVEAPDLSTDDAFLYFLDKIRLTIPGAVSDVMTCEPDHILMGMSAETFWGGKEGSVEFEERVRQISGDLGVTTGSDSCNAALDQLGVSSIACLTPYQSVADEQVHNYFTDCGFDVKRVIGLRCETATSIADVEPDRLIRELRRLDGADVEAIVQCGTNLSMVEVADQAERWLGKPVLAINAVSIWHALRSLGFDDQFRGHGIMLRQF